MKSFLLSQLLYLHCVIARPTIWKILTANNSSKFFTFWKLEQDCNSSKIDWNGLNNSYRKNWSCHFPLYMNKEPCLYKQSFCIINNSNSLNRIFSCINFIDKIISLVRIGALLFIHLAPHTGYIIARYKFYNYILLWDFHIAFISKKIFSNYFFLPFLRE